MQRFRIMRVYSASVAVILVVVIGGAAWLRQPASGKEQEANEAAPATQPAPPPAPAPADAASNAKVMIDNFNFKPRELTVPVGATVTWVNQDDVPHTATSAASPRVFDSKALDTDDKFSFKFNKPGTYRYYCKIHTHMTGTVIVK